MLAALSRFDAIQLVAGVAVEPGHEVAVLAGRPSLAIEGRRPVGVVALGATFTVAVGHLDAVERVAGVAVETTHELGACCSLVAH